MLGTHLVLVAVIDELRCSGEELLSGLFAPKRLPAMPAVHRQEAKVCFRSSCLLFLISHLSAVADGQRSAQGSCE